MPLPSFSNQEISKLATVRVLCYPYLYWTPSLSSRDISVAAILRDKGSDTFTKIVVHKRGNGKLGIYKVWRLNTHTHTLEIIPFLPTPSLAPLPEALMYLFDFEILVCGYVDESAANGGGMQRTRMGGGRKLPSKCLFPSFSKLTKLI